MPRDPFGFSSIAAADATAAAAAAAAVADGTPEGASALQWSPTSALTSAAERVEAATRQVPLYSGRRRGSTLPSPWIAPHAESPKTAVICLVPPLLLPVSETRAYGSMRSGSVGGVGGDEVSTVDSSRVGGAGTARAMQLPSAPAASSAAAVGGSTAAVGVAAAVPPCPPGTPVDAQSGSEATAAGGSPRRLRVLIADDNRVNRMIAERVVRLLGHEAILVGDGQAALEAVQVRRGEGAGGKGGGGLLYPAILRLPHLLSRRAASTSCSWTVR